MTPRRYPHDVTPAERLRQPLRAGTSVIIWAAPELEDTASWMTKYRGQAGRIVELAEAWPDNPKDPGAPVANWSYRIQFPELGCEDIFHHSWVYVTSYLRMFDYVR